MPWQADQRWQAGLHAEEFILTCFFYYYVQSIPTCQLSYTALNPISQCTPRHKEGPALSL
jgi:hypothetical protein